VHNSLESVGLLPPPLAASLEYRRGSFVLSGPECGINALAGEFVVITYRSDLIVE
jgi:hypothetical protein